MTVFRGCRVGCKYLIYYFCVDDGSLSFNCDVTNVNPREF